MSDKPEKAQKGSNPDDGEQREPESGERHQWGDCDTCEDKGSVFHGEDFLCCQIASLILKYYGDPTGTIGRGPNNDQR